ncbi:LysR substrate-binding domain-containing protein [Pseudomonas parafulva]|jgi:DNA-binding transcriptional LysR family regulator|uniref:LysR substrate-binding domain-containing protein n=1 Tax=Pseudomonas parafulva TaxID=157782 RepID=UPI0031F8B2AA
MVAMPIGPPLRMVTVASPAYLKRYGVPERPEDLMTHRCINLRLPTHGGLYPWEFTSEGREFRVRVQGPLIMNSSVQILEACLAGVGLAQLADAHVHEHIESGALEEVLREWSETFPGLHVYYPRGRHQTAAFKVVLNALRSDEAPV